MDKWDGVGDGVIVRLAVQNGRGAESLLCPMSGVTSGVIEVRLNGEASESEGWPC